MAILRPARVQNRNRRLARVRQIFPGRLQARFWTTVDALEAFIKISGANVGEQMELVDREIEERASPATSEIRLAAFPIFKEFAWFQTAIPFGRRVPLSAKWAVRRDVSCVRSGSKGSRKSRMDGGWTLEQWRKRSKYAGL